MDIKTAHQEHKRLQAKELKRTQKFISLIFGRHSHNLDLSNHYLSEPTTKQLCSLLQKHRGKIKQLIMKNCLLTSKIITKLLDKFKKTHKDRKLRILDISNNRLSVSSTLASHISSFFFNHKKPVSIILQGNLLASGATLTNLLSHSFPIHELNLYDSNLSDEAILSLSRANLRVARLIIAFNSTAFSAINTVRVFAQKLGENTFISHLDLSGIESLSQPEYLQEFCTNISSNRSLESLSMASMGLGDIGVHTLNEMLLLQTPIAIINIQNNIITSNGISELMREIPGSLSKLDISYNEIQDPIAILQISGCLFYSRCLRALNMSHTIEMIELDEEILEKLSEALGKNDSLTEFYCEGVKISENPDKFCSMVNAAISLRKLSLTYKISAVNCSPGARNSILGDLSLDETSERLASEIPSRIISEKRPPDKWERLKLSDERSCTSREFLYKSPTDSF